MKKLPVRVEYIFLVIACVVLTNVFFFKTHAESNFLQRKSNLANVEQNFINGTSRVPDMSLSYRSYTYFDSSLNDELNNLYKLELPENSNAEYKDKVSQAVGMFSAFSIHVSQIERRLLFGYDSLIVLSLILFAISFIILIANNAEQKKEISDFNIRQDEQMSISRDLHDGALQELAALRIDIQMKDLEQAMLHTDVTISEIRQICGLLRSDLTESFETIARNRAAVFEKTYALPVTVFCASHFINNFSQHQKLELLRILEEGLSNIGRHAHAKDVQIKMIDAGQVFMMSIIDDGIGMPASSSIQETSGTRIGIKSIQERADRIGAKAEWKNDNGTTLVITMETGKK